MGTVRLDPFADIDLNAFTVETLDIWETRQATIPPKEFIEVTNINSTVEDRIKLLGKKVTVAAEATMGPYKGFFHPSKWLASSTGIVEIDDSHELINYTSTCIPVQIAVQTNTRVYYDARLYAKLDSLNKAALILHELMYSWVKNHTSSSFNVRKYVGLMMLKEFESYPYGELFEEINSDFKVQFRKWFDCEKTMILEDVEVKTIISAFLINAEACSYLNESDEIRNWRFSPESYELLKNLQKKIGMIISEFNYKWVDGKMEFSHGRLQGLQWIALDTITPTDFFVTQLFGYHHQEDLFLVKDRKIVKELPVNGKIRLLNQEITLEGMVFEKKSDKYFLSSGILLEKDMLIKATTGLKKTKQCRQGSRVHFNFSGLMVNCTEK